MFSKYPYRLPFLQSTSEECHIFKQFYRKKVTFFKKRNIKGGVGRGGESPPFLILKNKNQRSHKIYLTNFFLV